jgi:hypothetical protein
LHTAQEKKKKFVSVIKPTMETANAAMDNIAQDMGAIASIFTHVCWFRLNGRELVANVLS